MVAPILINQRCSEFGVNTTHFSIAVSELGRAVLGTNSDNEIFYFNFHTGQVGHLGAAKRRCAFPEVCHFQGVHLAGCCNFFGVRPRYSKFEMNGFSRHEMRN